jgi:hypothetical protein
MYTLARSFKAYPCRTSAPIIARPGIPLFLSIQYLKASKWELSTDLAVMVSRDSNARLRTDEMSKDYPGGVQ